MFRLIKSHIDLQETEAKSKKLQMMRQKRLTLLAEVRFLRRRYKYLKDNRAQKAPAKQDIVQPQKLLSASRRGRMERSRNQKDVVSQQPVPRFYSNEKGKIHGERKGVLGNPALGSKLKQKHKPQIRKEASLRAKLLIPDLNQKERICIGKVATVRNNTPIFDLNEISREEEELQANDELMRLGEPKISLVRNGNDEQHNDTKLLACRNIGNGSTQGSKRKISWLDQVALRV
uniref:Uncharacterized protein n=1 Tax=Rhizophora mucronata TaxID=61149 RepID=A0A2P2LZW6_RHIMU